jgi:hypothetical protein
LNQKSQGKSGKSLSNTPQSKGVQNTVQIDEKLIDLAKKWDSLTDIEKQLIMKLLK